MSRPRESILSLFDPLHSDAPDGEGSSDEYDSDKENSAPAAADITIGTFFNTFKTTSISQQRVPKKRLVDIGDLTVDESCLTTVSEDDEEEDENDDDESNILHFSIVDQTPKARAQWATRTAPRTPLGEINNDHEPTPVGVKRMLKRQLFPAKGNNPVIPTQDDCPLSSFVNDINAEGVSFSQSKLPKSLPEIKVSSPQSPVDTGCSSPDVPPTPRPRLTTNASPNDRLSLDLHASFQLQFDSGDASFDLLNDKISFFGNSRDFSGDDDDEDEAEDEENTPPAISPRLDAHSPVIERSHNSGDTLCPVTRDRPSSSLSIELPEETHFLTLDESLVSQRQPPSHLFDESQTDEEEEAASFLAKDLLVTPAPKVNTVTAPPAIQALRIVKRPRPAPPVLAGRRVSSRPQVQHQTDPVQLQSERQALSNTIKAQPSSSSRSTESEKHNTPPFVSGSGGPRRVPIAELRTTSANRVVPPVKPFGSGGPRRVMVSEMSSQRPNPTRSLEMAREAINAIGAGHAKAIGGSGRTGRPLVAPAVAKEATPRAASTIPRPVSSMSRLPAPGFGYKGPKPVVAKAPTGLARRA